MKGLIVKDLKLLSKVGKAYLIFLAVLIVLALFAQNMNFLSLYAVLFTSILGPNTIAYDERDRWDKFALTLPVSKVQYVSAKYLLSLLLALCAVLLAFVVSVVHDGFSVNTLVNVILYLTVGLFYPAISLPLSLGFGYAKSKLALVIFAGVTGGAGVIISRIESISAYIYSLNNYVFFAAFLAVAIIFALSWFIAIKLYQKREL